LRESATPKAFEGSSPARILFVGINTSGSHAHDLFPRWMDALGVTARLEGVDLPPDAPPSAYRALVQGIADSDDIAGAIVTSHKLPLFAACRELFADLDAAATLTHEVNCVWKTANGLAAGARDPLAIAAVLPDMLGADHWQDRTAETLCFGTGGAATAIALSLLRLVPPPRRLTFTDIRPERLAALETILRGLGRSDVELRFIVEDGRQADGLLEVVADRSLVVNATGLGKDIPGSPIGDEARFPLEGVAWDINVRGELSFLAQARKQQRERRLRVHDGWSYFLRGWFQALAAILGFQPDATRFERFRRISGTP
jgi:shikimate 5-dehydrogenase